MDIYLLISDSFIIKIAWMNFHCFNISGKSKIETDNDIAGLNRIIERITLLSLLFSHDIPISS